MLNQRSILENDILEQKMKEKVLEISDIQFLDSADRPHLGNPNKLQIICLDQQISIYMDSKKDMSISLDNMYISILIENLLLTYYPFREQIKKLVQRDKNLNILNVNNL